MANSVVSRVRYLWCYRALAIIICFLATGLSLAFNNKPVGAIAKQSSLTLDISQRHATLQVTPLIFGKTTDNTVTMSTDNFSGYTLKIFTSGSTSFTNAAGDEVESISSAVDESTFTSSSAYNNKWGYRPSQYVSENNTVENTDFLPAPSVEGDILAKTNSANNTDDSMTLSFGAKTGLDIPSGNYNYTYNLVLLANTIIYNITYDKNTTEDVSNMPNPNPQILSIDGGTPAEESYASLSNARPTRSDKSFRGWCDVPTTINATTGDYECSGTTYVPGESYPIDQTADGSNIILYAIWTGDPFPVVWSQMGTCVFHGKTDGNITGSECQDYTDAKFINTGIDLYGTANYQKDFEVHFKIESYNPSDWDEGDGVQQTFFNNKLPSAIGDKKAPGLVVRKSTTSISVDNKFMNDQKAALTPYGDVEELSVYRIDNVIYYSVNRGPLVSLQEITDTSQHTYFDAANAAAWFGGYPDEDFTKVKRVLEGSLSNMYIRLGDVDDTVLHTIVFNAGNGLPPRTEVQVMDGNPLNALPEVTRSGWVLDGWFTQEDGGEQIDENTVPDKDETYWAHWTKGVIQALFKSTHLNAAVGGTSTIVVTNAVELEPYTFSSNNTQIATVDPQTGVITGVSAGSTTISMTGSKSGYVMTIDVKVADELATLTFDTGQGSAVEDIDVGIGDTVDEIPITVMSGYTLEGWYTGAEGTGTKLTKSLIITEDMTFIANWIETTSICKIATTLHEESCNRTERGCIGANYTRGEKITYGTIPDSETLSPGFAYTCDINADNYFDEETERFYYLATSNNNASFVWYKNMFDVNMSYASGLSLLPDSSTWMNTNLIPQAEGKVARFMKLSEANTACEGGSSGLKNKVCDYLMEKTNFANTNLMDGVWIQKINDSATGGRRIHSVALSIGSVNPNTGGSNNAPRPVIEVPLNLVEKYVPITSYDITFDPHNGEASSTVVIDVGDAIGANYPSPDPTYGDFLFHGWYTAASGGDLVTSETIPTSNATYHAQWRKDVTHTEIDMLGLVVPEGGTETLVISNVDEIEDHTFSSDNTSILTVDETTGVMTGVSVGYANITITGTQSGKTYSVNVAVAPNVIPADVCKLADSLHTGMVSGGLVTYGQLATSSTPQFGDAYDCDVDDNDNYNAANERFYYVGKKGDNAVLVAFSSFDGQDGDEYGWHDPTSPDAESVGSYDYVTALATLPSTSFWINPSIIEQESSKAARFLEYSEVENACGSNIRVTGGLDSCKYLLENSSYDSRGRFGIWLKDDSGTYYRIQTDSRSVASVTTSNNSARPVIEVPYDLIQKGEDPITTEYTVSFNSVGGSNVQPKSVQGGSAVGALETPVKPNYQFFGWYTDSNYSAEVTPETIVNSDVTYYAKWVYDNGDFRIAWSETNACTFNGASEVTGDYCEKKVAGQQYIDTGKALFTATDDMYTKDFEIGFTVVEYDKSKQVPGSSDASGKQATLINSKREVTGYPGFVVRRNGDLIELTAKFSNGSPTPVSINSDDLKAVKIVRRSGKIYYAWNGGELTEWFDTSGNSTRFDTTVWFGSSAQSDGITPMRPLVGTLTDMYIKIGTYDESNEHTVTFDPRGGTASETSRVVEHGGQLGNLPTVTKDNPNYTFLGWYTEKTGGVLADPSDIINENKTYWAHWDYDSSDTPVSFEVTNAATRSYQTIINNWLPDITTFNKDPNRINDSTWGISENTFWTAIQNNFESNQCMYPYDSNGNYYGDTTYSWVRGTIDCSKPDAYNTGANEPLDVYLYDLTTSTRGAKVNYTKSDKGIIYNMIPGKTYYWEQSDDSSIYGYVSATSVNNRRLIDAGEVRNVRDLGGLPATYVDENENTVNGTLKYEKLFRGERLWKHGNTKNAEELANLGVTREYDLRESGEGTDDDKLSDYTGDSNSYLLNTIIHYNFDYGTANYAAARNAVTQAMEDIRDGEVVFFHCRVGADRTGTLAYLLEGLLGVPDEYRYQDYELTHLSGLTDRTRYYKQKSASGTGPIKFVFMMGYVLTTQNIYDWYMAGSSDTESNHPDADLIQDFRDAMIDKNQP